MREAVALLPGSRTLIARFEEGPRSGTVTAVLALESGHPPDVLLTPGRADCVYVLAGAPYPDGSLPYLYMPPKKAAAVVLRARAAISSTSPTIRTP